MAKNDTTTAFEGIARAFRLDPFDPEVAALEQEIRQRQARKKIVVERSQTGVPESTAQAAAHLDRAEQSLAAGEYDAAFDEVTKAMSIDPLNARAQDLEKRIALKLMGGQGPQQEHLPPKPAPALDDTISAFRRTLDELSPPPSAGGATSNAPSPVADCIARAKRLLEERTFDEALAEIAIALIEQPDDPALREMESKIWEERDRQGSAASGPGTPLRLIHPRKSAAGPNG
jgi:tetratricopeptide (TPR) repeat protein